MHFAMKLYSFRMTQTFFMRGRNWGGSFEQYSYNVEIADNVNGWLLVMIAFNKDRTLCIKQY